MEEIEKQIEIIKRNTLEIIQEKELYNKLKKKSSLRIKYGADPSAPDIHLGHTIPLRKLRQFQELGHKIIFIIGDFTAMIGDPSGRTEIRKQISKEEVKKNAETYAEQVYKILAPDQIEMLFNSQWFSKMKFEDIINLASKYTVARMLERDDFAKRFRQYKPISISEFLYPLMQGYDSIIIKADVEIGGTDQIFNFLLARELQREYGQEPQVIITLPLLEGIDGSQKMSKSLGNYIGINEEPKEIFGKIMSISDEVMLKYYTLLQDISLEEINLIKEKIKQGEFHPKQIKRHLGKKIVEMCYNSKIAEEVALEFDHIFVKKGLPYKIEEVMLDSNELKNNKIWIAKLLVIAGLASSHSEAKRLISQDAVMINGERIKDSNLDIEIKKTMIVKVGKRKFRKINLNEK